MAAPVIESSNSQSFTTSSPISITKPTGLAEGELLCAVISNAVDGSGSAATSTPAGWKEEISHLSSEADPSVKISVYTKVADSSDVAASNFSFTTQASPTAGILFRISNSGGGTLTEDSDQDDTSNTTANATLSVNTTYDEALLLMVVFGRDGSAVATTSGYTVSGTNPTWTEQFDTNTNGSSFDHTMAVASAEIATARTITTAAATWSTNIDESHIVLVSIAPPTPVTVTPDSVSLVADNTDPTLNVKVTVTPDSVGLTNAVSGSTNEAFSKTWTTTPKS